MYKPNQTVAVCAAQALWEVSSARPAFKVWVKQTQIPPNGGSYDLLVVQSPEEEPVVLKSIVMNGDPKCVSMEMGNYKPGTPVKLGEGLPVRARHPRLQRLRARPGGHHDRPRGVSLHLQRMTAADRRALPDRKISLVGTNITRTTENTDVTDLLHYVHQALDLPLRAKILALAVVASSPLVVVKWRRGSGWHRSGK